MAPASGEAAAATAGLAYRVHQQAPAAKAAWAEREGMRGSSLIRRRPPSTLQISRQQAPPHEEVVKTAHREPTSPA